MYITSGQANRSRSIYQILTWFRGFQDKLLYLVWFSLRDQRNLKKITILTRKLQGHVRIVIYRKRPIKNTRKTYTRYLYCIAHAYCARFSRH